MIGQLQHALFVASGDPVKAEIWNHNAAAINKIVTTLGQLRIPRIEDVQASQRIAVRLTGNAPLRSNLIAVAGGAGVMVEVAWKYSAVEARPNTTTAETVDVPNARIWNANGALDSSQPPIFNLCEFNHTGSVIFGRDMALESYPDQWRPKPVGGGGADTSHRYDRLVEVWQARNSDGDLIWVMDEMGSHDGPC